MANSKAPHSLLPLYLLISLVYQCSGSELGATRTALLQVNASEASGQPISETFFGLFFEVHSLTWNGHVFFSFFRNVQCVGLVSFRHYLLPDHGLLAICFICFMDIDICKHIHMLIYVFFSLFFYLICLYYTFVRAGIFWLYLYLLLWASMSWLKWHEWLFQLSFYAKFY